MNIFLIACVVFGVLAVFIGIRIVSLCATNQCLCDMNCFQRKHHNYNTFNENGYTPV